MLRIFLLLAPAALAAVFFTSCGNSPDEAYESGHFYVTVSIRVDTLAANIQALERDMRELVPEDGVLLAPALVTSHDGDSVFDVLQRVTRAERIHMVARFTPVINEAYVEAIGNIFAFDAGALSGWTFSVNGVFPMTGASSVAVSPGDDIVWAYTLDLGRDVGVPEW